MIVLILIIIGIFLIIEGVYKPRIDITSERDVLLWYNMINFKTYIKKSCIIRVYKFLFKITKNGSNSI